MDALTGVSQEMRYAPWGATRFGSLPTTFRYTGQRAEPGLDGVYFYGARWYDPYLNRFLSPDSIIPDPYNPLDYDRYSYVQNNPVNLTDPTGHCYNTSDACLKRWGQYGFHAFGIKIKGLEWTSEDRVAASKAVHSIAQGIARAIGSTDTTAAFKKAFGPLTFTMVSTSNICGGCKGQTAYPNINFVSGVYQRNVAHELGHAFDQAIWNRNGGRYAGTDNPVQWLTENGVFDGEPSDDNLITGTRYGQYTRWNGRNAPDNGYRGDRSTDQEHALGFDDWATNVNENFADIFLNWSLGGFVGSRGDALYNWVETNMATWVSSGY